MNRILLTIIGFAIAIATYGQTTFTSEEYFKMAVKARQEGKLDDARRYIKYVIDSSGDYELRKMAENFFEEIMTKLFPNLGKETDIQIQRAQNCK